MTGGGPDPDLVAADAILVAALLAIDPAGLGGAVLRSGGGPARDQWLKAFRKFLTAGAPVLKLPHYAAPDRLVGGLDVAATLNAGRPMFEPGLLAAANGGALILTSAERLETDKAALVAAAIWGDTGFWFPWLGFPCGFFFHGTFMTGLQRMGGSTRVSAMLLAACITGAITVPRLIAQVLDGMGPLGFFQIILGLSALLALLSYAMIPRMMRA